MPRYNSAQEKEDLDKIAPKLKKAIQEQRKREKGGKWVLVEGALGNMRKLVKKNRL